MSSIIHYEVYVYQGNAWDLLGRYPSEQRAKAIEYARTVETAEGKPTKVVRETYDLETQTFLEAMVYLSEIPKPQAKKSSPYANSAIPTTVKQDMKKKAGVTENVAMIFLSIIFSMALSAALTAGTVRAMIHFKFPPYDVTSHSLLGIFTFYFLVISVPTALKWVNWHTLLSEDDNDNDYEPNNTPGYDSSSPIYPKSKPQSEAANRALYGTDRSNADGHRAESTLTRWMGKLFDSVDHLMGRQTLKERQEEARQAKEAEEQKKEAAEKAADDERKKQVEEQRKKAEQEKNAEKAATASTAEQPIEELPPEQAEERADELAALSEEEPPAKTVIPHDLERDYLKLTTFLSIVLRVLQEKNTLLNAYVRFGIELFLAGACDQICKMRSLTGPQNRQMLAGVLELLGRAPNLAGLFYDKLNEYMMEPKYLPVIESGAKGMEIYLNNKSSPELISLIQATMTLWQSSDKKEMVTSGIYTVMFTDIVSSTHMTQMLGDRMAQQLIHRHNMIVRQALASCGGEEIKQTGDGIMASFIWASNAIDAAIAIQRGVALYNEESPTVPLQVRIGLNSGEPIVENKDMFGLTVQIAARVCNEADKDQIYVSSVVKELANGKNYQFNELGAFSLKGIDEPQTLYEVVWQKTVEEYNQDEQVDNAEQAPAQPAESGLADALPEF